MRPQHLARLIVLCTLLAALVAVRPGRAEPDARPFPDLTIQGLLDPGDYAVLGLDPAANASFRLSDVDADLLILEFFNKYCLTCWRVAPQLETFVQLLPPGDLAGKVQVLGIGAGNNAAELEEFRERFGLSYALAPDPFFEHFDALGDEASAPTTLFLEPTADGWRVAERHTGFYGDVELLARARVLLKGRGGAGGDRPGAAWTAGPVQPDGPLELEPEQLRGFLERVCGQEVQVAALEMADDTVLYEARDPQGRSLGVYARAAVRTPVCDLCHPVHFLFAFDRDGVVRGFTPLVVTKFGNELWDAADTEHLRRSLVGRTSYELVFDPGVDAVTSATMSSALIFDEVRRSAEYLPQLQ